MKLLAAVARWIDALNEWIGVGVSWLTAGLVLVVCFDVFTRYVLNVTWVAVQELQWHLFALIFLFGAAWTLKDDKHVRVDLIYARLGPKGKASVDLAGCLLFLIPFCAVLIAVSLPLVAQSFADGEGSPNPGGLPARYLLKACIPIAFGLVLLQGIAVSIRSLFTLLGRE